MTYYLFAETSQIELDPLKAFLYRINKTGRCAVFAVNDGTRQAFLSALRFRCLPEREDGAVPALGEDGALYWLRPDGIVKISDNAGTLEKHWKKLCRFSARLRSEEIFRRKVCARYSDGIRLQSRSVTGYHRYVFVDRSAGVVLPFRFKAAKKKEQPLVVYFGGGGTIGHRNIKPLLEFLMYARGALAAKRGCNLFVPQATRSAGNPRNCAAQCNRVVELLIAAHEIDPSRVYAYGTSFGGKCTWRALLDRPDLYAAAVEVMGALEDEGAALERIADIPLWLAHAADDRVVPVESDDRCFERLKALGAEVRYTRRDRQGHQMYKTFFRNEGWLDWLLSKKKS